MKRFIKFRSLLTSSAVLAAAALLLCGCGNANTAGTAAPDTAAESPAGSQPQAEQKDVNAVSADASASEAASASTAASDSAAGANAAMPDKIDMSAWQYNEEHDVYWQTGISYCGDPADMSFETLGLFIPGAYFDANDNGDGTFTCTVSSDGTVSGYTAETAPVVLPVETPGYSAMNPPDGYQESTSSYTDAGFIYLYAGCRGRDQGAPAGVTDLKAAIRYYRYNEELPGNADSIFSFGMSGGGAQSALLGATGNSSLYDPYLEAIGAVSGYSDAVAGSMCWCPITSLDTGDAAYEWNLGETRSGLSDTEQKISDALAESYAAYINQAGIKAPDGTVLTLEASDSGIYQAGTYYDYIKNVIETSLEHFLADTEFPYDTSAASSGEGGFGDMGPGGRGGFGGMGRPEGMGKAGGAGRPEGMGNAGGNGRPEGMTNSGDAANAEEAAQFAADGIGRSGSSSGMSISGVFDTPQDYIDALNAEGEWVSYDAASNTVSITSVQDFVKSFKNASKSLGAFDQFDGGQGENTLFGYGDGSGAHFDSTLAGILSELAAVSNDAELQEWNKAYAADLEKTDVLGNTAEYRLQMYSPLYYLLPGEAGYGNADVAKYWRIRTGINQGDTALSTEVNLALALEAYEGTEDVDFETVWGRGHVKAERTGSSDANFIEWVNACLK